MFFNINCAKGQISENGGHYRIKNIFYKTYKLETISTGKKILVEKDTFSIDSKIYLCIYLGIELYYDKKKSKVEPGSLGGKEKIHSINFFKIGSDNKTYLNNDLVFLSKGYPTEQILYYEDGLEYCDTFPSKCRMTKNIDNFIQLNNSGLFKSGREATIEILTTLPNKFLNIGENSFEVNILFEEKCALEEKQLFLYKKKKLKNISRFRINSKHEFSNSKYFNFRNSLFIK